MEKCNVEYPADLGPLVPLFRQCATARLFLHTMLPDTVTAGIYLDTDLVT